tara:strand:+ start:6230 stop:7468 length:1239 start_codon:yes stop_codon:yes gene_type:complete
MVLNRLFISFFLISFFAGFYQLIFLGNTEIFPAMMNSTFDMAKVGFEISINLTGVLTLWLGIMKIGENGGFINIIARMIGPFFNKLFPDIPENHPVFGTMIMNFSANMLGLDNAATPMGLKAMTQLQELNPDKDTASNSQIMFLVLNTSGLTLIPVSIMAILAEKGAANPADVFIPILLTTFFSTVVGLVATSLVQKINILNKTILLYLGIISILISGFIYFIISLPSEKVGLFSSNTASILILSIIIAFIVKAIHRKVNVYDSFIDGAKEGFHTAIKIIPYLIAILVAIGIFRASGVLDLIIDGIRTIVSVFMSDTRWVEGLPTAFMKPLSGSGARGMMVEAIEHYGVESFQGKLVSIMQGSTDTTFYVIALYFGSVGIKNTRNAISLGLLADFAGIVAAIVISYFFYGNL